MSDNRPDAPGRPDAARPAPRTPARAEVVGSLLRPRELRDAVDALSEPGHSALLATERSRDLRGLGTVEDGAIREAVRRQEEIGLDVVTDGEFRRWMFLNSFYDAVEGFDTEKTVAFTGPAGEPVELHVHRVTGRLRRIGSPAAREAAFMASVASRPFKVTFPAASLFTHPFSFDAAETSGYESLDELVADMVELERGLIADAVAAGCRYVQLDFPLYPYLVDPAWRSRFEAAGHDPAAVLEASLAADRAVLDGLPPHVTRGLHVCRGNYRSSWMCAGSLEPVAEAMFSLPYDVFLVEWDDLGRDGGFEPLARVPSPGPVVVMGLVSTKTPLLEAEDDLLRRLDEAASYLPLEQLAISPQCGFASVVEGNLIDEETQWRKLELVAGVAGRVWP
jgi:5-methyltetrahydropteroyltriglutamate--homocysteine methyltransferase